MTSRSRVYSSSYPAGGNSYRTISGTVITNVTQSAATWFKSQCDDSTGNGIDHPLSIVRFDNTAIMPLNGELDLGSGNLRRYTNFYPPMCVSHVNDLTFSLPTNGAIATSTLAATNPSRPYVSIPNFVFELKDLPEMIRDIGLLKLHAKRFYYRNAPGGYGKIVDSKSIANHYLSGVMGWAPLISDLRKMLDFQSKVDRKVRDLDRLFNHNEGLHRTFRTPSNKVVLSTSGTELIETSLGTTISCRVEKTTTAEKWGSTRWNSTALLSSRFTSKELQQLAWSLVTGTKFLSPKAIWDAIPWTWLVAWFTNVDTFLQAYTNVIPVEAVTPCVMYHIRTEAQYYRNDTASWCLGGGGTRVYEQKYRFVQPGTLSASIPFLGARELSILGALGVQRLSAGRH